MHREKPFDFWLTLAMVASLFVPIWGILLKPSRLISVPMFLLVLGSPALLIVIGGLVYGELNNRVLVNRFIIGYLAGFAGSVLINMVALAGQLLGIAPGLLGTLGKMMLDLPAGQPVTSAIIAAGAFYHYILNGSAWGAVYALVFGKAPWWFGALYGLAISAILLVSPSFYTLGFQHVKPELGALLLASIVVSHLIYGSIIGVIVHKYVFPEVGVEGAKAIKPTYA